jgi:hypothetical protein
VSTQYESDPRPPEALVTELVKNTSVAIRRPVISKSGSKPAEMRRTAARDPKQEAPVWTPRNTLKKRIVVVIVGICVFLVLRIVVLVCMS